MAEAIAATIGAKTLVINYKRGGIDLKGVRGEFQTLLRDTDADVREDASSPWQK
jgi:hypothetical protein